MSNSEARELVIAEEVSDAEAAANQERRRGGRPPGESPSKKEFRAIVQGIIDRNSEKIETWLEQVANGKPTTIVAPDPELGIPGGVINGVDPDPAKALDLMVKLAEFAAPKLSRSVIAGDPDNPALTRPVVHLTIGGKKKDG
jgi:hypothetical protein